MRRLIALAIVCFAAGCSAPSPTPPLSPPSVSTSAPTTLPIPTRAPLKSGKIRYLHLINVNVRFVPTLMALDALQAQGYTVERTALASSTLIVDALTRGDAEFGSLNPQTMWAAAAKGAKVRTFFEGIPTPGFSISKQEIQTCRDLDGKRVGFAAPTGINPTLFDLYIKQNCPNIKFSSLIIPESAGRIAGLLSGDLDASQLPLEDVMDIERKAPGKFRRLIDLSKEFPNLLTGVLNVRGDWAEQNPEVVKDFVRELLIAQRRVIENPQVLYDESSKRLGISSVEAKESGDANLAINTWGQNGGVTQQNVAYTLDFLVKINAAPATLKVEDVSDLSYLDAVLKEIGRK